jgi:hypothetical protein
VLEGVPVDRIRTEAREIRFARTMLTLAAGLLYGLGWLVARAFAGVWAVVAWSAAAVRIGWREGTSRPRKGG